MITFKIVRVNSICFDKYTNQTSKPIQINQRQLFEKQGEMQFGINSICPTPY